MLLTVICNITVQSDNNTVLKTRTHLKSLSGYKFPKFYTLSALHNHEVNFIFTNFRRIQYRHSVLTPVENVAHMLCEFYMKKIDYIICEYISHTWLLIWSLHQHCHKFKIWCSHSHADKILDSQDVILCWLVTSYLICHRCKLPPKCNKLFTSQHITTSQMS